MGGCFRLCFGVSFKNNKNPYHRKFKILPRDRRSGSHEPLHPRFYPEQDTILVKEDKNEGQLSLSIRKKDTFGANVKAYKLVALEEDKHDEQFSLSNKEKGDANVKTHEPVSVDEDKITEHLRHLSLTIRKKEDADVKTREPLLIEEDKLKEHLSTRKKVTFDTNVRMYEPVSVCESTDVLAETIKKKEDLKKENLGNSSIPCYPSNHRYNNCEESDEEVDELESLDSYTDDEDSEYAEEDGFESCEESIDEALAGQEISSLDVREKKAVGTGISARDGGVYVHPVLNPVGNLAQWKSLKTKMKTKNNQDQLKKSQEIAVDASLSNWLVSTETTVQKKATFDGFKPISTKMSTSTEDRSILGASVEGVRESKESASPRSPSWSSDEMHVPGSIGTYRTYLGPRVKDIGAAFSYKSLPNTRSNYQEVLV